MSNREWKLFLEDILESIELIENYILGMDFSKFEMDRKTQDAVIRNLEIIGEAAKYIHDNIKEKYSAIDWKGLIGLRNRIVHEYFGISLTIIWNIIRNELPGFKEQIKKIQASRN